MTECPSQERLQAVLDDLTPEHQRREISDHVDGCDRCQEALERLTSFQTLGVPAPSNPGESSRFRPLSSRHHRISDFQLDRLRGLLSHPSSHQSQSGHSDTSLSGEAVDREIPGYEVVRELGRGGMAIVYQARHLRLNRPVALKMIRSGEYATPEQLIRFGAEGEIIARLRHPNIVQIYEVGSHKKQPYFALELVAGGSLDAAQDGRPIPARIAARLIETIARAIDYAHSQGVIHRDLKPANILLSGPGSPGGGAAPDFVLLESPPKITDFGLAKNCDNGSGLTQTGVAMGTPSYMAPEQVRGLADLIGPKTDVYSLGAILYELLTGRPPFLASNSLDILNQVTQLDPVAPSRLIPQVPRDLEVICLKCLEKEPSRRYATAGELADDLGRFLRTEPIQARRLNAPERAWRWAGRRPAIAGLLAALAIALASGLGGSTYFALEASDRARHALLRESEARIASEAARKAEAKSSKISSDLLLDRALNLANQGQIAESLHWLIASHRASTDPAHQQLVRTHLAGWASRVPVLTNWLDTFEDTSFSPTGPLLVAAGRDRPQGPAGGESLQFWDYRTGLLIGKSIEGEDIAGQSLAFSPDGLMILRGNGAIQQHQGRPGWITRWDVQGRRLLEKLVVSPSPVVQVTWTPDGRHFLVSCFDKTVLVYDAQTSHIEAGPWRFPDVVNSFAFSPDGQWVLVMARLTAHLIDLKTGDQVGADLSLGGGRLKSVAFGHYGRELVVGGVDGTTQTNRVLIQRWNPDSRTFIGSPRITRHPSGEIAPLPDGRLATSNRVSHDGDWFTRIDDGIQVFRFPRDHSNSLDDSRFDPPEPNRPKYPTTATFSPDGATVWILPTGSDELLGWDVGADRPSGIKVRHVAHYDEGLRASAISSTGLICSLTPTPQEKYAIRVFNGRDGQPVSPYLPSRNIVNVQAFSPDGSILATGGLIHWTQLWEVVTGRPVGQPLPNHQIITDMAFSPDGRTLAVSTLGGVDLIWDVKRGELACPPLDRPGTVGRVRFSPDGSLLATIGPNAAFLWDARSGKRIATLRNDTQGEGDLKFRSLQLEFNPSGTTLLTTWGRGSFRLWNRQGQPLGPPTPHGEFHDACFAFSSDGKLVIVGHDDGRAQVWDAETCQPLGPPATQPRGVVAVRFRPDGRSFVTVADDGSVRRWPVRTPLEGDIDRIDRAVVLMTGLLRDDTPTVSPLTRQDWEKRRRDWLRLEGAQDWRTGTLISESEWHDARARDAEQTGRSSTAIYHLNRLISLNNREWRLFARRGQVQAEDAHWPEAKSDFDKAAEIIGPELTRAWILHQARLSRVHRRIGLARWYYDEVLRATPQDGEIQRERDSLRDNKK